MARWIVVVAALCAAAAALPTSSTTQGPLIVTQVTGDESSSLAPSPAPTSSAPPASTGPPPPLKVTELDVRSDVSMRYARTAVVTRVRNPADRGQQAFFKVLIPETAFISGFQMTLDGKTYKAYVKGKEEAKKIYEQAVSQGISAGHVAAKARDSREFTLDINVGPNSWALFNLTYEEILIRRNGVYNHDVNLLPGAPVPQLTVVVRVREAQPISTLRVPEVRTGNEIDATDSDPSNAIAVIERSADNREATITFKPNLEEQKRLMQVYEEKSREAQQSTRRYTVDNNEATGVLGQFVVQYDVERPKNGEILVNDGYFVHFFAPESLPPLTKLVVFVLDTSGSMSDRKIVQLREAMQAILAELNPGDYFSIVEFSSSVKVHDLKEADEPAASPPSDFYYGNWNNENTKKVVLVPPASATKENIDKAKVIVSRLVAVGGTNIASALDVAIDIVNKGVPKAADAGETGATGATGETAATGDTGASGGTGATGDNTEAPATDASVGTPTTEVTPAIDDNDEEKQELESIIVFLTDGEPTVGETDPKRIISRTSEKNSGPRKATIFCLAFGEDADRVFLRKLALRNDGFMRHIYEAADAALQLRDFYRQISSPLLDDVRFVYPPDQIAEGSLTKHKFRTYYAGSEVVVAGRVAEAATELAPQVVAFCGVDDGKGKKQKYEVFPRVPVALARDRYLPLERLWVSLTIRQLLDLKDAADAGANTTAAGDLDARAKDLAIQYELVTPLTSLVVVKPNATNAVDTQSSDEPNRPYLGGPLAASSFSAFPNYAGQQGALIPNHGFSSVSLPVAMDDPVDYEYVDSGMSSMPARVAYNRRRSRPKSVHYSSGVGGVQSLSLPSASSSGFSGPPGAPGAPGAPGQYVPPSTRVPVARPTTVANKPTATDKTTAANKTTVTASSLQPYHLELYSWAEPLLDTNAEALVLQVNGTSVNLKLTKDTNAPVAASDEACARATSGGPGVCVYLTRCGAARYITQQLYADVYCAVQAGNQGFAGVCCPSAGVAATSGPAPSPAP